MIEYKLTPTVIPAGKLTEVTLVLVNVGQGTCTNLQVYLGFPKEINLIDGLRELKVPRLRAGEQIDRNVKIIGKRVGLSYIELLSMIYFRPDGSKEKITAEKMWLQIQEQERQDVFLKAITLSQQILKYEEWNLLVGTIRWQGNPLPENVRLQTYWPLVCNQPSVIPRIEQYSEVPFRLYVQPKEYGDQVPVKVTLNGMSGVVLYEQSLVVHVIKETPHPGNRVINIRESNVTIADRSLIQQEVKLDHSSPSPTEAPAFVEDRSINKYPDSKSYNKETQMTPIDLIISAIIAGASKGILTGTAETVSTAIKDLYVHLKTSLGKHITKKDDAITALALLEKDPNSKSRKDMLTEELIKLEVDKDEDLTLTAQAFLQAIDLEGKVSGKYNIDARYSNAPIIGENNTITQNFYGEQPKKK